MASDTILFIMLPSLIFVIFVCSWFVICCCCKDKIDRKLLQRARARAPPPQPIITLTQQQRQFMEANLQQAYSNISNPDLRREFVDFTFQQLQIAPGVTEQNRQEEQQLPPQVCTSNDQQTQQQGINSNVNFNSVPSNLAAQELCSQFLQSFESGADERKRQGQSNTGQETTNANPSCEKHNGSPPTEIGKHSGRNSSTVHAPASCGSIPNQNMDQDAGGLPPPPSYESVANQS